MVVYPKGVTNVKTYNPYEYTIHGIYRRHPLHKQELQKESVSKKKHIHYKQHNKDKNVDFCMVFIITSMQPLLVEAIGYGDRCD